MTKRLAARACVVLAIACACSHAGPRGPVVVRPVDEGQAAAEAKACAQATAPHLVDLCAMGEPSLQVAGPETYRFVWRRHLRNPVAVRVTRAEGGVAVVSVEADARHPQDRRRHEFVAGPEAWTSLRARLDTADFWNTPGDPDEGTTCLDCADWIIEGRRAGLYHSVVRGNPGPGPFRAACEELIKISGLAFPEELR